MTDKRNAKYVESKISWNNMKAFICKNSRDSMKFLNKVRDENGLVVNVVTTVDKDVSQFRPPIPLQQLK